MSTNEPNSGSTAASVRAQAECRPTCGCGQDLDCCSRAHCPRCGTVVVSAQLHPEHVGAGPLGWAA